MEYIVEKVSQDVPRLWKGPHGDVFYIKTMLKGHEKPVSIGKKKPDALSVGDTVYGTIEPSDLPEDKFKAEQRPQGSFGGGFSFGEDTTLPKQTTNDTQESIARSVALKAAVDASTHFVVTDYQSDRILKVADEFLAWLQGKGTQLDRDYKVSGIAKARAVAEAIKARQPIEESTDEAESLYKSIAEGEQFDPNEIPF